MRMAKLLTLLLTLTLILGLTLSFVSCGGTTEPTGCTEHKDENGDGVCDTEGCNEAVEAAPAPSAGVFNENGELILVNDGVATFSFVMGKDASSYMNTVRELAQTIGKLCKDDVEPAVKNYSEEATEVEIIIGTVDNRGAQYNINRYDYGNTGYMVKQIGTKIIVTGGSDTALANALNYLKGTVFGIKKTNDDFTTFAIAADKNYDVKQSNYSLKEINIADQSIRNYVITYTGGDNVAKNTANMLQTKLYDTCGIRLEVVTESRAGDAPRITFTTLTNDGEGGGYYVKVDANKNLVIECEYAGKSDSLTEKFFNENVFTKKGTFTFASDYSYAPNYRDVYYKDYGAIGDGRADDFFALKAAHDDANEYLLNVHADPNATYLIGAANENKTIYVKTNTYWHGCKFIFNDEVVDYTSAGREVAIFSVASDYSSKSYSNNSKSPIKSLEAGATNVGWAPGKPVMIVLYQSDIRHYIRYGANASQSSDPSKWGQGQHELIIIDKDGNVDPSTPVQWTYTKVSSMTVYDIDDRAIEIRGEGEDGRLTEITTWYNDGPNAYWYYYRNIRITRSNVKISGVEHKYDKYTLYSDGGHGSPYNGFVAINNCSNVVVDNFIYECPPGFKDVDPDKRPSSSPNVTNTGMGSYEISAALSNNITWSNSTQSNFFQPDGSIQYDGSMGTNFCKNLTFDNMFTCSFDAHCGVYNATINNSIVEHLNFIGDGTITIKDVVIYADANRAGINLREDYGATWAGRLDIDGLIFKVEDSKNPTNLHIVKTSWHNWFFGYTTYLPQYITMRNVLVAEYTFTLTGEGNGTNNRVESDKYVYNKLTVRAFPPAINEVADDLSAPTYQFQENLNPMVPTKEIWLYTEYTGKYADLGITEPLKFKAPSGPFHKTTKYYIDGELQTNS